MEEDCKFEDEASVEAMAKKRIVEKGLIQMDEDADWDACKALFRCDDYTQDEIDEDENAVDWDFAYGEVLQIEERKKDKM